MAKFTGTSKDDRIIGSASGDIIVGIWGDDHLFGGSGGDTLKGGAGNDFLVGGDGIDRYFGGTGNDTFRLAHDGERDKIMDFERGTDLIDVRALGAKSMDDLSLTAVAGGVMLKAGGERTLIKDAKVGWFSEESFVFTQHKTERFENVSSQYSDHAPLNLTKRDLGVENLSVLETDESTTKSGYIPHSGDNVIYNDGGNTAAIYSTRDDVFDLESAWVSAAWRKGLQFAVSGYVDDVLVGTQIFTLNPGAPKRILFDDTIFDSVNRVEFATFGGTATDHTTFNARQFCMDDLLIL